MNNIDYRMEMREENGQRVYYIDVGNLPIKEAKLVVQYVTMKLRDRNFNDTFTEFKLKHKPNFLKKVADFLGIFFSIYH